MSDTVIYGIENIDITYPITGTAAQTVRLTKPDGNTHTVTIGTGKKIVIGSVRFQLEIIEA